MSVFKDGVPFKSGKLTNLRRGFAEGLIDLGGTLLPGTYQATVKLLDSDGLALSSLQTASFTVPSTPWLGKNIGVSNQVQQPWSSIGVNGTSLSVWGRTYDLSGGFGLPQQITSKGQSLLAEPITIEFDRGAGVFQLSSQSLQITSVQPHKVTWTGTASGGGIEATVSGSLEYDGMMLITLTLSSSPEPVLIKTIKLQTVLRSARALYYHATGDNAFWWYPRKTYVPTTAGTFMTNVDAYKQKTPLMPSITFSDDDRGLEWFAESVDGWQIWDNPNDPIQELIRDANGNVRLQNSFATQQFTLSSAIRITFGYEATPIKALPADWRTMQIAESSGNGPAIPRMFDLYWSWPDDSLRGQPTSVWPSFRLSPGVTAGSAARDLATYAGRASKYELQGLTIAPFYNQHVTIASGDDLGTQHIYTVLNEENLNDGWIAQPTKGTVDYWVYHIKRTMESGGMGAIYVDEPFVSSAVSADLLSGRIHQTGWHARVRL